MKCVFTTFSLHAKEVNGKAVPTLTFKGDQLAHEKNPTFLGLTLDSQLTFTNHIEEVKKRMAQRRRCLTALAGRSYGSDQATLRAAYIAYIRSVADYGAALYSTHAAPSVRARLEAEQHKCARVITGCIRLTNSETLITEAGLTPLALQAEQAQRAAAAKAELARRLAEADAEHARRQAEAQAEQARQQAEAQAEQSRRQAEQAEAQAALEAQAAKDEAECRQLELELLEQEERGSQLARSYAAPSVAGLPVVATEPPVQVCVSRQTDESVTRTRQWLTQSQLHVPPVDTAPVSAVPPPAMRLQRPSSDDTRAVPHLPRITLEKFGGSAIEWPRWIALFKALVHDRADLTDVERLTYLQTHLTGPARESVRGMLCDASLYSTALCELEREFGDPSRVIHATMKRLLTARPVKDGDLSALTELSRELHTAVSVLQCLHYEHDLAAATNVTAVTGKLPASLAWRWGEHMVENGITRPTLVDLDEWLHRHVSAGRLALNVTTKQLMKVEANDAECRPRRVFTTASARPTPAAVKRERTAAIKSSADGHSDWCTMCQQTHELQHCDEFLALTVSEKAEFVGRNGLCFNCLGRDHISATCPSDARCDAEHCGRRHHTLLHNGGRVFPLRDSDDSTPSSAKHVGTASAEPRSDILLQVVPITVNGPAGSRTTNALLDLGSQITLITDDLCDRLGISGTTDKLVLSTLSGTQTTTSRRVSLAVEAVGGDGRAHRIRNAQTTPTLNVSAKAMVCTVAKEKWPHLADMDLPSATHGPVEVLLGIDVIELIVPREVIEGPTGTPCAVRTLLGWTVTGRASERSVLDADAVTFRLSLPRATRRDDPPAVRKAAALEAIAMVNPDCTIWSDGSAKSGTRDGGGGALIQLHRENREVETLVPAGSVCSRKPNEVLKAFLFNDDREEMEHNKDGLYRLWRLRRKLVTEAGDEERA
ncbi:hypothetical protein FJT64_004124 [Amphibalanus amphitrite]|uniref:Uncharacterized protein n=1 Tax=Amphibalanus amphitrite TaxID=1232801 RepID=A0A6A4W409_AMPAM|nr:hypothetical protein FJT64_004124 [Amphibalanus amphitrite]